MKNAVEVMKMALEKCQISLGGKIFSEEVLIQAFSEFLFQTMEKRKHNVGFILHSGSECFDALLVTYASILNLISNETSSTDIIESLDAGDIVLYGEKKKERFIFDGIIDGSKIDNSRKGKKYIQLRQKENNLKYISMGQGRFIEPYNGISHRLDGRGIRRNTAKRDEFYIEVLGFDKSEIPSVIDTSTVLIIQRERAENIIKGIEICFSGKKIKLLDLITASYFTEEDEYPLGRNAGKSEPNLKICSRMSVARKLIFTREGNRHIGVIVSGEEIISRGRFELPEFINRKSLQYIYVCEKIDNEHINELFEVSSEIEVFACTKEFLREYSSTEILNKNSLTIELAKEVNIIVEKKVHAIEFEESPIDLHSYFEFKKILMQLKKTDYESDEKNNFIIQAYSLMRFFLTAVFPLNKISDLKNAGIIEVETPERKLVFLQQCAEVFPPFLQSDAIRALDILNIVNKKMESINSKERWIRKYIYENKNNRIAIVVPKGYYIAILKNGGMFSPAVLRNISIYTSGRFEKSEIFDTVIAVGDIEGKSFDAFSCNASLNIFSLLYPAEQKSFLLKKRNAEIKEQVYNEKLTIGRERINFSKHVQLQTDERIENDEELEEYISTLNASINIPRWVESNDSILRDNATTEIVAVATFSDDSIAFFSKHYRAYVLDENIGDVKEIDAADLCEGDSVIFTKNNNDTRDIVDSILRQLISDGKLDEKKIDQYRKSKAWKQNLFSYTERNNLNVNEAAESMISIGVPVQVSTVLHWLDEDSHIVGPQKVESIKAIGILTGDKEMEENAEIYFEACRAIRTLRKRILKQVGKAIINKLVGKKPYTGTDIEIVFDKIDSLSMVLQIDRIVFSERVVPINIANRPINV